ncbi:MAG: hypothetical protein BGO68_03080 [Candidatus Amoebophilus sp. 36-38]|nr:MAG: hypothetical protein BGO68_03080 [Candidatus Amoebophilus sp. 36-38]
MSPTLAKYNKLVAHGFFARLGGVSNSVYQSLNCNIQSADRLENVIKNQTIVCHSLGFTQKDLRMLDQVHSASVITIKNKTQTTSHLQADALVTKLPNLLLGVKTADCIPILLFDVKNKIIAVAHAGWKGAVSEIIDHTILAMQNLGAEISHIVTALGPCIQQKSYEVDQAFYNKFIEHDALNKQFFINAKKIAHYMFDLPRYCVNKLKQIGIQTIDNLDIDTYSNPDTLFSFRRATHENKNPEATVECGRQLSVIGML